MRKGYLVRPQTDARILSDIKAEELLETDLIKVHPDMLLKDLIPLIKKSAKDCFPVEDKETGDFLGMVYFSDIRKYLFDQAFVNFTIVSMVMKACGDLTVLSIDEPVSQMVDKFDNTNFRTLPVAKGSKFVGIISKSVILDHYRKELKAQTDS